MSTTNRQKAGRAATIDRARVESTMTRELRAKTLGLPECPEWCGGVESLTDGDLCCFRCWFSADPSELPDETPDVATAPTTATADDPEGDE